MDDGVSLSDGAGVDRLGTAGRPRDLVSLLAPFASVSDGGNNEAPKMDSTSMLGREELEPERDSFAASEGEAGGGADEKVSSSMGGGAEGTLASAGFDGLEPKEAVTGGGSADKVRGSRAGAAGAAGAADAVGGAASLNEGDGAASGETGAATSEA